MARDQSRNLSVERHSIHLVTTRQVADKGAQGFSGERGRGTYFASIDVSVPAQHTIGQIERPRRGKPEAGKHFVAAAPLIHPDLAKFRATIEQSLQSRAPTDREILIFVHGFNNSFEDSVFRTAQIVHDAPFPGVPLLFTWASRGSVREYLYDRESATIARDNLELALLQAARSSARRIHILAHSMGSWLTLETLRQLAITGNPDLSGKLGDVILASPDVDVDVFKSQMKRLGRPSTPYTVIVSRDDRALRLSGQLAGNKPRLGAYADDPEIAELGITVVDTTNLESGGVLKHAKFSESGTLVKLLGAGLSSGSLFARKQPTFADRVRTLGIDVGEAAGSAAGVVIAAPTTLLTRPGDVLLAPVDLLRANRGGVGVR